MSAVTMLPDPEVTARLALALVDGGCKSFSPGMSNEMTVRSFEVERLAAEEQDPLLKTEMFKYAFALRHAGEVSFALSGAVIARLGQMIEASKR